MIIILHCENDENKMLFTINITDIISNCYKMPYIILKCSYIYI